MINKIMEVIIKLTVWLVCLAIPVSFLACLIGAVILIWREIF